MAHKQNKWPKERKERLTALARSGVSVAALAECFETSRGFVYRILEEMGW